MKTELTKNQSAYLIGIGVPREKASNKKIEEVRVSGSNEIYDCFYYFTLTDLLEILPKEIEYEEISSELCIWFNITYQKWDVGYTYDLGFWKDTRFRHTELIDALYELLCWVIENGYLKFE